MFGSTFRRRDKGSKREADLIIWFKYNTLSHRIFSFIFLPSYEDILHLLIVRDHTPLAKTFSFRPCNTCQTNTTIEILKRFWGSRRTNVEIVIANNINRPVKGEVNWSDTTGKWFTSSESLWTPKCIIGKKRKNCWCEHLSCERLTVALTFIHFFTPVENWNLSSFSLALTRTPPVFSQVRKSQIIKSPVKGNIHFFTSYVDTIAGDKSHVHTIIQEISHSLPYKLKKIWNLTRTKSEKL